MPDVADIKCEKLRCYKDKVFKSLIAVALS